MKIKTSSAIKTVSGESVQESETNTVLTVGSALSRILSMYEQDSLRAWILAQEVFKAKDEYEVKSSDVEYMKEAIKAGKMYFAFVRAQLLELLNEKEEKGSK
jgi:hypothetical protein